MNAVKVIELLYFAMYHVRTRIMHTHAYARYTWDYYTHSYIHGM